MGNYKHGGYEKKYHIQKIKKGMSETFFLEPSNDYLEPTDPNADYFVLRLDKDPHAQKAMLEYAESVRIDNKELSDDIFQKMETYGWYVNK